MERVSPKKLTRKGRRTNKRSSLLGKATPRLRGALAPEELEESCRLLRLMLIERSRLKKHSDEPKQKERLDALDKQLGSLLHTPRQIRKRASHWHQAHVAGAVSVARAALTVLEQEKTDPQQVSENPGVSLLAAFIGVSRKKAADEIGKVIPEEWHHGYTRGVEVAAQTVVGRIEGFSDRATRDHCSPPEEARWHAIFAGYGRAIRTGVVTEERFSDVIQGMLLRGPEAKLFRSALDLSHGAVDLLNDSEGLTAEQAQDVLRMAEEAISTADAELLRLRQLSDAFAEGLKNS